MRVPRPIFVISIVGAFLLGAAVILYPVVSSAAEGPKLPPAKYKQLPEGTNVEYEGWSFIVTKSEGFKTTVKTASGKWFSYYGIFGKEGSYVYSNLGLYAAETEYKEEIKTGQIRFQFADSSR